MAKHIIWSNMNMDYDDWKADLESDYPECTEDERKDLMYTINDEYLQDERVNLDVTVDGRILVIADLGLWNGRHQGYKILSSNIKDILYTDSDYAEWYGDGKDIKGIAAHHDGTNFLMYRVIKEDRNIVKLLSAIYNGEEISRQQLSYYTKSLYPYVAKIYGWR